MHPLNRMLSIIPDTDYVRKNLLSYADHQASEEAVNMARPERDFNVNDALDYFNVLPFSSMIRYFSPEGDLPKEIGFHFFDIDQTAFYGFENNSGNVLLGTLDTEKIADALSESGYAVESTDSGLLIRADILPSISSVNPLRHNTVTVQADMIHSLPQSVYKDTRTHANLLDNLAYNSGASALIASGAIRQAQFIPVSQTRHLFLTSAKHSKQYQRTISRLQTYDALPMYQLVVIGDVIREKRQYIEHVFVYDDMKSAEKAVDVLNQRLQLYYKMPDFLDNFSGTIGILDTSIWSDIILGQARLYQADLPCVIISLERELPPIGRDYKVSRINNLYRLVIERVHNNQADYLAVTHTILS